MPKAELVNYACYGSMTQEVAEALLNRYIHYAPARIPAHGIRMLRYDQMSDAERAVMQGSPRFIAVPDHRYTRGIYGGIIFSLPIEETVILQAFDNSSENEYEVAVHQIIAVQGLHGQVETSLPAVLVARKKIGRNYGEWRHPSKYAPYEPFEGSVNRAIETVFEFRESFLKTVLS